MNQTAQLQETIAKIDSDNATLIRMLHESRNTNAYFRSVIDDQQKRITYLEQFEPTPEPTPENEKSPD